MVQRCTSAIVHHWWMPTLRMATRPYSPCSRFRITCATDGPCTGIESVNQGVMLAPSTRTEVEGKRRTTMKARCIGDALSGVVSVSISAPPKENYHLVVSPLGVRNQGVVPYYVVLLPRWV